MSGGGIIGGGKYKKTNNQISNSLLDWNSTIGFMFEDEVGAIVIDMGSHTTRAGYAGEDMPKVFIKSTRSSLKMTVQINKYNYNA